MHIDEYQLQSAVYYNSLSMMFNLVICEYVEKVCMIY